MSTFSVERRDRAWLTASAAFLIGPMSVPSADSLRDAVERLIQRYPHSRLNWRLDDSGQRWITDRSPESVVEEGVWDAGMDHGAVLEALRTRRPKGTPYTFIRYPNHLGLSICHGIGDGGSMTAILGGIPLMAMGGEIPDWPSPPRTRYPLLTAGLRTFGRHPVMIAQALQDKRSGSQLPTSEETSPWEPSPCSVVASMPRAAEDEMVAWAQRFSPRPSRFALMTCAVLGALDRVGLPVAPDIHVLMDLRKYLGQGWIDGNFVANVPIPATAQTAPGQLSAAIKNTLRSGRPLANQMLASWHVGGRRGNSADPASRVDPRTPAILTLSDLGQPDYLGQLPFSCGESAVVGASGPPDGPTGVTVATVRTPRTTTVTASFHDNGVDARKVRAALGLLAESPLSLLSSWSAVP
jgi:hypothetical protein